MNCSCCSSDPRRGRAGIRLLRGGVRTPVDDDDDDGSLWGTGTEASMCCIPGSLREGRRWGIPAVMGVGGRSSRAGESVFFQGLPLKGLWSFVLRIRCSGLNEGEGRGISDLNSRGVERLSGLFRPFRANSKELEDCIV